MLKIGIVFLLHKVAHNLYLNLSTQTSISCFDYISLTFLSIRNYNLYNLFKQVDDKTFKIYKSTHTKN